MNSKPNSYGTKNNLWKGNRPNIPNDLEYGQQLKWFYPNNNESYDHWCGFDLPKKHNRNSCP